MKLEKNLYKNKAKRKEISCYREHALALLLQLRLIKQKQIEPYRGISMRSVYTIKYGSCKNK